ncbi:MAG: DUF362 domain-containing protein, partial [Deltaproteobacteria bacterium]|nr:DUF362 domain-containing protein [Deltaproteobacteria bacterium]
MERHGHASVIRLAGGPRAMDCRRRWEAAIRSIYLLSGENHFQGALIFLPGITVNGYRVSCVRCDDYDPEKVNRALTGTLAHLSVSFKSGMKVLIKPNLMSPVMPERAITTHPVVLEELCKIIKAAGAEVLIGESAFYNTDRAFGLCGIEPLTRYARLINFEKEPKRFVSFGGKIGAVPLPEILFQVDSIINVAKMKTHGLTGVTLCAKNLYGCVPGAVKQGYHKT